MKITLSSRRIFAYLLAITAFALVLRLSSLTPYLYYPDSYQSLLVAENINRYGSVLGYLGENGSSYPPFPAWTRPVYPVLIAWVGRLAGNLEAARLLAFLSGVAAVPAAYFAVRAVSPSRKAALAAAILLAASFNHTVWSGSVMTETPGVLMILLSVWTVAEDRKGSGRRTMVLDYLSGAFLALSVLMRYEYAVTLIPFAAYILFTFPHPVRRFMTMATSMLVVFSAFWATVFPSAYLSAAILRQTRGLVPVALSALFLGVVTLLVRKVRKAPEVSVIARAVTLILFGVFAGFTLYKITNGPNALYDFARSDPFVFLTASAGLVYLAVTGREPALLILSAGSILPLFYIYYKVNPGMERYMTHLLPFLLIPASVFIGKILRSTMVLRKTGLIALTALLAFQIVTSFRGFRAWGDLSWFEPSYEEESAVRLKEYAEGGPFLLLVSLPEPYYFFTGISATGISDEPPFLHIPEAYDAETVMIVQDEPMRIIFPRFNSFLDARLAPFETDRYRVVAPFHYLSSAYRETGPVRLFEIPLKTLRETVAAERPAM